MLPFNDIENVNPKELRGPARRLFNYLYKRRFVESGDVVSTKGKKRAASKAPTTLADLRLEALRNAREQEEQAKQKAKKKAISTREAILAPPANNWTPVGPSVVLQGQTPTRQTMAGRTPGIAVAPGGTRIYAATANGGVWRSENSGNEWVSLMDSFDVDPVVNFGAGVSYRRADSLCCGAIALSPGDTAAQDTIFIGTGEPHTGTGDILGIGPLVSSDGGATWVQEPVVRVGGGAPLNLNGFGFFSLAVDPANPNWVVGAMNAGIVTREPLGGGAFQWVFRQPDPALDAALAGNIANLSMSSVVVARAGGITTFFAAAHGIQRNNTGGNSNIRFIYSSTDGGQNWNRLGNQIPANQGRITLAVRKTDPAIVYAFASTGRVFRFEQGDNRWRAVNGLPPAGRLVGTGVENQGWYDLAIAVAPDNSNRIFLGGSTAASNAAGGILATAASPEQWGGAIWRCELTVTKAGATVTNINIPAARRNFIGGSCHADIHALVFGKTQTGNDDPNQLWVGCDGGVFFTNNPTGNGLIFQAKNNGLQTLMMHHIGLHPTEDSVLFCGTQDNGGLLFTGEESWVHSTAGDCGFGIIKPDNPSQILSTYTSEFLNRSTNGGATYPNPNLTDPVVNLAAGETVEFYAPLVGSTANPNRVAFGTNRLRISNDFGATWPQNLQHRSSGFLDSNITALAFATADRVFAGTTLGSVYRFDRNAGNGRWDTTRLYDPTAATPPTAWPNSLAVNDIAVDPTDANTLFITLEATGAHPHVWRCDSSVAPLVWTARSGPAPGGADSLPNVHHSAIVIDTENFVAANPAQQHLYVGTDIGIWRSTNGGGTWQRYADGLPDVAVLDLKILPSRPNPNPPNNIIRPAILFASTHGRGVWQRHLVANELIGFPPVELFIRRTDLDLGRHLVLEGLNNINGTAVNVEKSPGIKLDTPSATGSYQLAQTPGEAIDFVQFTTQVTDSAQAVTHDTEVRTRVYVQVHNRGVMPANDVRVTLLFANKTAAIPALPAGYDANVRNGVSINTPDWKTVGSVVLHNVRVGFPKIAAFELSSTILPAPAALPPLPTDDFVLVAMAHHAEDPYHANDTDTRANVLSDRKSAMKTFPIVAFAGTAPALAAMRPPLNGFAVLPSTAFASQQPFDTMLADALRLNDGFLKKRIEASLSTPMAGRVHDTNVLTNPSVREIVMAEEINLTSAVSPDSKVPVVWFARTKITLRNTINAAGKGSPNGEAGDFGGSGGGGSAIGQPCNLPLTGTTLAVGGATGTGPGNALNADWATRALLYPAACKGGAAGGGANGGAGGGVVILCAPVIEFAAGGIINASGQNATGATSGGGGGGLIALIAGEIIGLKEAPDAGANALVAGGTGSGGGNGGNGLVLKKVFN
ncbi:MAG: hypothetical protein KDD27_20325 [Saprospiraceae bacterium]|nr:hypothetical protein [Saprospiraceae bacterium]